MEYGCIGEHLTHSFSKEIHNALTDYDYCIQELTPEELPQFMTERIFKAINVTISYKKDVIPYLEWISPEAKTINAVNTIVNIDGKLYGYNTDFYGLKSLVERQGVSLSGKCIAILGSGGTSNTAFAVSNAMGAEKVHKVSRKASDGYITYDELYSVADEVEVIINTTPCGMYPHIGTSAVDVTRFTKLTAVFDAVYNPNETVLLKEAIKAGAKPVYGIKMLLYQGVESFKIWTSRDAPVDVMEDALRKTLSL
jgi:shikimate dehydrogenase